MDLLKRWAIRKVQLFRGLFCAGARRTKKGKTLALGRGVRQRDELHFGHCSWKCRGPEARSDFPGQAHAPHPSRPPEARSRRERPSGFWGEPQGPDFASCRAPPSPRDHDRPGLREHPGRHRVVAQHKPRIPGGTVSSQSTDLLRSADSPSTNKQFCASAVEYFTKSIEMRFWSSSRLGCAQAISTCITQAGWGLLDSR